MHIIWKGQSCFQILVARNKGEQTSIVIDPFDETIGLRVPKLQADILLVSHNHPDHNNIKAVSGNPFLIEGPGEYEIKGIFFQGISSFHDDCRGEKRGQNTIYTIEVNEAIASSPRFAGTRVAEEMRICHLGDLGQKELTSEQVENIGDIDILMLPVGGVYTINSKESQKIISQIEPKIVIPMHYQIPKLKLRLEGVDKFLKTMGQKSIEPQPKLLIKKKDFTKEGMKIVILKP